MTVDEAVHGDVIDPDPDEVDDAARRELCWQLELAIRENLAAGRQALWTLAENLHRFNEENGWTALGYANQGEWLAQPEINLTRTDFFRLVRRHKVLVIRRKVPMEKLLQLEPSKVDIVMATIKKAEAPLEDVLEDVQTLGARDLREKYVPAEFLDDDEREITGGAADEDNPVETDGQPVKASEVGVSDEQRMVDDMNARSAGIVDSWIESGGDRRKAQRHWLRLVEDLPFFQALAQLEATLDGTEGKVSRQELGPAWETIVSTLNLTFPEA